MATAVYVETMRILSSRKEVAAHFCTTNECPFIIAAAQKHKLFWGWNYRINIEYSFDFDFGWIKRSICDRGMLMWATCVACLVFLVGIWGYYTSIYDVKIDFWSTMKSGLHVRTRCVSREISHCRKSVTTICFRFLVSALFPVFLPWEWSTISLKYTKLVWGQFILFTT